MGLTPEQYAYLMNPLKSTRVANRSVQGKSLSYLEAWDVKAHLIRIFGFGGFDSEVLESQLMGVREYQNGAKEMIEVFYKSTVRLQLRDADGGHFATYTEAAVGSASGPATSPGDLHDNALKTASSDALKRCAINLGTQFGLSLYDNGNTKDIIAGGPGVFMQLPPKEKEELTEEQKKLLETSLGATEVGTEQEKT